MGVFNGASNDSISGECNGMPEFANLRGGEKKV